MSQPIILVGVGLKKVVMSPAVTVICLISLCVSVILSQDTGESTTSAPDRQKPKECSRGEVKEICLSDWRNQILGIELSKTVQKVLETKKTLQGTCIQRLGFTGWFDGETMSCRECSENGCAGDYACLAGCSVVTELLKIQRYLDEIGGNYSTLQGDLADTSSELKEQKVKASHSEDLAILAIVLSLFGFATLFIVGWVFYKRLSVHLENRGVQQTSDVRYERDKQQKEENRLLPENV